MSCFRHQFDINAGTYEFCDFVGAARFYDAVMRLARVTRERLGLEMLDVRYEDLVADFDGASSRICAFLGLPWQSGMGDVAARARAYPIQSASAVQVARGLFDGSGQWRNYRAQLEPVLPILAPWVAHFGYSAE